MGAQNDLVLYYPTNSSNFFIFDSGTRYSIVVAKHYNKNKVAQSKQFPTQVEIDNKCIPAIFCEHVNNAYNEWPWGEDLRMIPENVKTVNLHIVSKKHAITMFGYPIASDKNFCGLIGYDSMYENAWCFSTSTCQASVVTCHPSKLRNYPKMLKFKHTNVRLGGPPVITNLMSTTNVNTKCLIDTGNCGHTRIRSSVVEYEDGQNYGEHMYDNYYGFLVNNENGGQSLALLQSSTKIEDEAFPTDAEFSVILGRDFLDQYELFIFDFRNYETRTYVNDIVLCIPSPRFYALEKSNEPPVYFGDAVSKSTKATSDFTTITAMVKVDIVDSDDSEESDFC